ncbi:nitrile hydratase subunit beta [Pseudonocardia sp. RS11V-5]|uniref:nitrile hydratase subunit beta n=1 Tax=Pseudonocardia terrae TaxID=2905831 RepID=UPI001E2B62DE|nr:nitrile hydratase subunit beta [Pseudonocardia terrae]MCE3554629.1 nitrile hydratase subunit beta [Pseudonocardia terrae]
MNGVFDLGGTDGMGRVVTDTDEPVFRAEWEKAAFAMFSNCFRAGFFGIDSFRHSIEKMDAAEYLLSNYYEHWVHVIEDFGAQKGVIDVAELEKRTRYFLDNPDAPLPERKDPELLAFVDAVVKAGAPAQRESDKIAKFSVGDTVTVTADSPYGHTRRARYIRGRTGEITGAHGTYIYPDSAGNGGPEAPEHLYTVRFTSQELWGPDAAEPHDVVYFDVWEPYLTLAS